MNYSIAFGNEDLFIETEAPKEAIEKILRPIESASSQKEFYDEALMRISGLYKCRVLEGKEIVERIKNRDYECLFFNW